nr:immunoglobulin heavy chain junction region [Macaca mulatta]
CARLLYGSGYYIFDYW